MLPRIVHMIRDGEPLDDLKAAAGQLWLAHGGEAHDADGAIAAVIALYWKMRPGKDPYWDFLSLRGRCSRCGESYKLENLAICPNCFKTSCYRHERACACGHTALG